MVVRVGRRQEIPEVVVRVGREEFPEVLALWREAGSPPATITTPGSAATSATL